MLNPKCFECPFGDCCTGLPENNTGPEHCSFLDAPPATKETADPNPQDAAEYTLTIWANYWDYVDGDGIGFAMVDLYDRNAKFSLICKVLDAVEKDERALAYTGTLAKCEEFRAEFEKCGVKVEIDRVQ